MESFLVIRGLCWHHEAIKSPAVQNRPLSVVHRWICILLIIGDGFWGLGICIFSNLGPSFRLSVHHSVSGAVLHPVTMSLIAASARQSMSLQPRPETQSSFAVLTMAATLLVIILTLGVSPLCRRICGLWTPQPSLGVAASTQTDGPDTPVREFMSKRTFWFAPLSGKQFHCVGNCSGLNRSLSLGTEVRQCSFCSACLKYL